MGELVAWELLAVVKSWIGRSLWIVSALTGLAVVLIPTMVLGNDQTYGLAAFPRGAIAGAFVGIFVGSLTALVAHGHPFDSGLRVDRYVAGQDPRLLSLAQSVVSVVFVFIAVAACALSAEIAGLGDLIGRQVLNQTTFTRSSGASEFLTAGHVVVASLATTILVNLLILCLRSGSSALAVIGVATGSWVAIIFLRSIQFVESASALHPYTLPWKLLSSRSDLPEVETSTTVGMLGLAFWVALLCIGAKAGATQVERLVPRWSRTDAGRGAPS